MPDLPSSRKPPRRFWLYAPYLALVVVIVAWSAAWWVLSGQVAARLDQSAARLRVQGWTVAWTGRQVGGYPFRLNVHLDQPRIAEPSGWSIAAPALDGEAYAYAPDHWVIVAPSSLTLTRPGAGAVTLTGKALRASFSRGAGGVPQVAVQGWAVTAAPAPGAKPLPMLSAQSFAFYLRGLPDDAAEFQLRMSGADPRPGGLLARLSAGRPVGLVWDQSLSHVSALKGRDWPSAVQSWSAAGGGLNLVHGQVDVGDVSLIASSGRMSVDASGYLSGSFGLDLSHARGVSSRLDPAIALIALARTNLNLSDGRLRLGPFEIGKAPKVY